VLGDRRSAVVLLSLAFVVIGLALATDRPAPLSQFLYEHAPLWRSLVRWRSMGIVLCSFSVCLLAGAGLEWLMSRGKTSGRWPLVASMVLACLIGGLVLVDTAYGLQVGRALQNYLRPKTGAELNSLLLPERYDLMGQYGWALLWTIAAAVLIACRGRHGMPAWSLGLALIVLLALDLFAFGWRQNYYSARNVYETRPATVDRVIRETPGDRILVTKATELAILCSYGSRDDGVFLYLRDACAEETSLPYRVFKTEGWLSAPTKRWSEFSSLTRSFRSTQREQVERLTGLLGASYLITPEAPWRLGEPPPRVLVVPVPRRLPRFFAVSRVVTASAAEAPRLMTADGFDASREAVLEAGAVPLDATGQGLVGSMRYELNRITAAVEDARHGYLVSTDAYYPGWDCFVGGRRVTMERADIVFRAIPVGTGSQPLDLVYRPASFLLGVWITLAGVAASMAAAGWWGATRWR
jgi:hypothetical protein